MRISDWSSDVCSSDLDASILRQRFDLRLDLAKWSGYLQLPLHPKTGDSFQHDIVAAVLQRLDISDPAQATDIIKRWRQTSVTRLYHADPPVSCHGIADKGAITRFEYMKGQVHAREQQRARQGEARDTLQRPVRRTGWHRGDDVATTTRDTPAPHLPTS